MMNKGFVGGFVEMEDNMMNRNEELPVEEMPLADHKTNMSQLDHREAGSVVAKSNPKDIIMDMDVTSCEPEQGRVEIKSTCFSNHLVTYRTTTNLSSHCLDVQLRLDPSQKSQLHQV